MSVQYEDSVMEFDLDFLQQSPNKSEIFEKQDLSQRCQKAILAVKKKIIATDSIIRKFYEQGEQFEQVQGEFHTLKEETQQSCINFQNMAKTKAELEKKLEVFETALVSVQEQLERSNNVNSALQSHANQLQILVQEQKTDNESLKVKNQLHTLNAKNFEKKVLTLQKEKGDLKKHLSCTRCICGKKKLSSPRKEILNKYGHYYAIDDDEDSVFGDGSADEILELGAESVVEDNIKGQHLASKKNNEHDSDSSNGLTSADTGRGSSLASSDVEKCFNSPDYFLNHSPINANNQKEIRSYTDASTSPIIFKQFVDRATSPLSTHENIENGLTLVINESNDEADNPIESGFEISTTNNEPNVIEKSIFEPENDCGVNKSIAEKLSNESSIIINISSPSNSLAEPISLNCGVPAENTGRALSNHSLVFDDDNNTLNISRSSEEKECLELNESVNYDNTNIEDYEVETILNTMRFNRRLITPLPSTPSKSHKGSKTSHFSGMKCKDAAKVKAESQFLSKQYFELAKEVKELKNILRNKCILDDHDGTKVDSGCISKEQLAHVDKSNQVKENCVITTHFKQPSLSIVKKLTEPIKKTIDAPTEIIEHVLPNKSVETAPKALLLPPVRSSKSLSAEILYIEPLNMETHLNSEPLVETSHSEVETITGNAVFPQKNENREQEHVTHVKHCKLSKLEKLRKKLEPKSKIKKYTAQKPRKLRIKPKQLPLYMTKVACETDAKLNNKRAHEKALKVLNELKTIQNVGKKKERNIPNTTDHTEMDAIEKHSVPENVKRTDLSIFGSPEPKISNQNNVVIGSNKHSLCYNMQAKLIDTNYVSKNIDKTVKSNNTKENIIEKNNLYVILEKIDRSIKYFPNRNNELVRKISKSTSPIKTITTRSYSKNVQEENGEKHAYATEYSIKVQKENSATLCKTNEIQQSSKRRQTRKSVESHEMARPSVEKVNDVSVCKHVQQNHVQEESSSTTKNGNENPQSTKKRQKRGSVDSNKVPRRQTRKSVESHEMAQTSVKEVNDVSVCKHVKQNHVQEESSSTTKKCNDNPQSTKKRQKRDSVESNKVLKRQTRKSVESHEMARTSVEKVNDVPVYKRKHHLLFQQNHIQEESSSTSKKGNENPQSTKKRQNRGSVDNNKALSEYIKEVNERRDVSGSEDIKKKDISGTVAKINEIQQGTRKRKLRIRVDSSELPRKRTLRSSTMRQSQSDISSISSDTDTDITTIHIENNARKITRLEENHLTTVNSLPSTNVLNYSDLDLFTSDNVTSSIKTSKTMKGTNNNPEESIFCAMIEKYGKQSIKNHAKKIPESVITSTCEILQEEIQTITTLPANEAVNAMNKLVEIVKSWDHEIFISGLMAYLKDSQRKIEFFNKNSFPPAPTITKSEQVLLYVISQLTKSRSCHILDSILSNIEYVLFKLNKTPDFDVIECISHFYAVLCRYYNKLTRLRIFMLDAMYCIQFKAVSLIKQCLEAWMQVLPLAHMGIAKSPLVTCMVYLLHFYKCDDRFKRVQDVRNTLKRKYFYEIKEWNESKIIEMFKNAINEIRAVPEDIRLLRLALIVIAKRHGAIWCQKNIVTELLLPLVRDGPERVKIFCINLLGPLFKPYPSEMKLDCELIISELENMLKHNPSHQIQEAIITSLTYFSKQNSARVLQIVLSWRPQKISPEMENVLRDYVGEKPMRVWKTMISKLKAHERLCEEKGIPKVLGGEEASYI